MVRAVYTQASDQKTSMFSLWLKPLGKKIGSGYSPPRQQHLLHKCFPSHVVSIHFSLLRTIPPPLLCFFFFFVLMFYM